MDIGEDFPLTTSILKEAHTIIYGDREKTYGHPSKNLELIAAYWSQHLSAAKNVKISLTYEDVAVMMILLKSARLANSPDHKDTQVDICGYTALLERCQQHSNEVTKKNQSDRGVTATELGRSSGSMEQGLTAAVLDYQLEFAGKNYLVTEEEYEYWLRSGGIFTASVRRRYNMDHK